jgi:Domain of unknown function (DUF4424)
LVKRGCITAIFATLAMLAPARADDGAASLAVGGIQFTRNRAIRMSSEDLYVSPDNVRVRFAFENTTDNDVVTMIAFPLPDIDLDRWGGRPEYLGKMKGDPLNFVGFRVSVNGRLVRFNTEQRAFLHGKDVTALLKASGVALNQLGQVPAGMELAGISKARQNLLEAHGLVDPDGNLFPMWTVRTRFFWIQVFPRHATVVIEHSYHPIDGTENSSEGAIGGPDFSKRYCVDASSRARVNALARNRRPNDPEGTALETDYILKTAKTWSGPIGAFHMTLDKLDADSVLSLCWDGRLKKTGPTTYEFSQPNYVPTRDIEMAVLR